MHGRHFGDLATTLQESREHITFTKNLVSCGAIIRPTPAHSTRETGIRTDISRPSDNWRLKQFSFWGRTGITSMYDIKGLLAGLHKKPLQGRARQGAASAACRQMMQEGCLQRAMHVHGILHA
jgi:hypothetical protein